MIIVNGLLNLLRATLELYVGLAEMALLAIGVVIGWMWVSAIIYVIYKLFRWIFKLW